MKCANLALKGVQSRTGIAFSRFIMVLSCPFLDLLAVSSWDRFNPRMPCSGYAVSELAAVMMLSIRMFETIRQRRACVSENI